jgi:hypothetical protein
MTTCNGTVSDQVEGLVEAVNERGTRVSGDWRNVSKFHPFELPVRGARVRLELDNKGFIRNLQVLEQATSSASSANRDCTITRVACLKAAASFAAGRAIAGQNVTSADVLKVAEAFERWVTKGGEQAD